MQFTISLKLVTVAILATALQANASNFVAFSGDTCNGAEGSVVSCNGDCGGFQNRHSFQVLN
ncbi:hypothetical protein FB45DRAFT_1040673 [Roridomyces roridus]|nr:hypothetical protein FB45DRAFT_1040673 [Roridomyces roridus]